MTELDQAADAEMVTPEDSQHTPAVAEDVLPDTLHLIPVPHRPFFPGQVQPVAINLEEWGSTLKALQESSTAVIGLSYVDRKDDGPVDPRQFPEIGCVVRLHRPPMMADNPGQFLAQGLRRFRIVRWLNDKPPYLVQVEYPRSQGDRDSDEIKAYAMALIKEIKELLPLNPLYSEELKQYIGNFNPNQPSLLADFSAPLERLTSEPVTQERVLHWLEAIVRQHHANPNLARLLQHAALSGGPHTNELIDRLFRPMFDGEAKLQDESINLLQTEGLQPWAVMAFNNLVMSYVTMAPMYRDLLGQDPFGEEALEKQLSLIKTLLRAVFEYKGT
jgi:Lon protease-like protein